MTIRKAISLLFVLWLLSVPSALRRATADAPPQTTAGEEEFKLLPGPGKRVALDGGLHFTYEFNEKPKLGMVILKIQVFDKKKNKVSPFVITGRSDMPSMRGAHDSGEQEFKLNKMNNYLLPVNIVMPGDWEVRLTFLKDGKIVFRGRLLFDV
ncbi:MAG: hypothetical protein FJY80_15765 [Candidatus Aminicenantes bacterium]|nr:hypothetical protein [Candidatus Aminicenantes bacterium]MBM3312952.1 hypothetical protein [Candidatus Aminicenantes bacterium]